MPVSEKVAWKNWADGLRQEMMTGLMPKVTKSVEDISSETATTKGEKTMKSVRFWQACQSGKSPNDVLVNAGFHVDFEPNESGNVSEVTLKLNDSWMAILQRVLDRIEPEGPSP